MKFKNISQTETVVREFFRKNELRSGRKKIEKIIRARANMFQEPEKQVFQNRKEMFAV